MEEHEIIDLYFKRSETAIDASEQKYGRYCRYIAQQILQDERDVQECLNDTYNVAWETIPPNRPNNFKAYLGKIVRNLALKRYERDSALKRGGSQVPLLLDELAECLQGSRDNMLDQIIVKNVLHQFILQLPVKKRRIFLRRYWYMSQVNEIAKDFGLSESNVKIILMRLRNKLREQLMKEGMLDDE